MSDKRQRREKHSIDDDLIRFIGDISEEVRKRNLTKVTLKLTGLTIEIEHIVNVHDVDQSGHYFHSLPATHLSPAEALTGEEPVSTAEEEGLVEVVSPITGTFYAALAPKKPPLVKKGDIVKEGATLCIVEAMKVMNKITSKHSGRIHTIEVKNGQVVQTGQVLMKISPD